MNVLTSIIKMFKRLLNTETYRNSQFKIKQNDTIYLEKDLDTKNTCFLSNTDALL